MVFHGTHDGRAPVAVSRALAETSSQVLLVETEGADHVTSWKVDPDALFRDPDAVPQRCDYRCVTPNQHVVRDKGP